MLTHAPAIDGIDAKILLLETYDQTYGIFDHDNVFEDSHPLALIGMHPQEDVFTGGRLVQTIRSYRRHRVNAHFNLSLTDFLNYPRHITTMILKECEAAEKEERDKAAAVLSGLPPVPPPEVKK